MVVMRLENDTITTYAPADFDGEGKIVKKGKKNFRRVVAE